MVRARLPPVVFRLSPVLLSLLLGACGGLSGEGPGLRGAVASNFAPWAEELGREFARRGGSDVSWSRGSTGKLYAQIVQGADFDLFLAADSWRPRLLVERGLAVPGSRFTYARGRLALWSPDRPPAPELLRNPDLRIALAHPTVAPYGAAAREVLERMEVWRPESSRLVRGENVGQAFAFVRTGAVDLGLVALSSARRGGVPPGELWIVPADWHRPLEQQAVRLVTGSSSGSAADFLEFLRSESARKLLVRAGYRV
ncbi:MAG: molybdate ABC transporter substrate-binding protein, partial [Thermoanaerobaculia bacterium]|nr:molybdate ABC transporter substrate-binding protein [Thermoanaerobaculia bacterium]